MVPADKLLQDLGFVILGADNVRDGPEIGRSIFVENTVQRGFIAGILTSVVLDTKRKSSQRKVHFNQKDIYEGFVKGMERGCEKYSENSESACSRIANNAIWQMCQSLKNFEPCEDVSYQSGSSDIIWSPYFWGGLGAILGILMVTADFLVVYCLCLKKKKNKGMTGGKGNGKGKMFKGSGSQETPMTPGTGSKSPIINGNGNNQKSPGGGFGNGKKYQQGVNPNQETYMY